MIAEQKTASAAETISFARAFASSLSRGDVIALFGDLGSGKTQFVKGVCEAFHCKAAATSPTFVILNRYEGKTDSGEELLLYHLDLYRITSPVEIYDLGYEEYFRGSGITCIEWADMLGRLLPKRRYDVHCKYGEQENERIVQIELIED